MKRVILSGGGTGGHIYPAVSVAEALKRRLGEDVEILFVGAEGKMEMTLIPNLGYTIKGVSVVGLQRRLAWKNLALPYYLLRSLNQARRIIKEFKPDVVVGFGGYASAPIVFVAQRMGVPTIIQEQNSYAGLVNKIVGGRAKSVCVAYDGMEKFFEEEKIVHTGNPLRSAFGALNDREKTVTVDGEPVSLTPMEYNILKLLMENPNRVYSSKEVYRIVWQEARFEDVCFSTLFLRSL